MQLTNATANNLNRVNLLVENNFKKCSCCNLPLPSWVELSVIDYCNRKCVFCPKSNDLIAPNHKHLYMDMNLIKKIVTDLKNINFCGVVLLAGYGEPMASPILMDIIKEISPHYKTEIVTNGDYITPEKIITMINHGISTINISVYSSENRYKNLIKMFKALNIPENKYILRDRWYKEDKNYGVKLTNRAGTVHVGNQPIINNNTKCYYPFYSMMIDWNGDVLLCPQDWHRKVKFGNVNNNNIHDIWFNEYYKKYRDTLYKGIRNILPCSLCNCEGTCHGKNHAEGFYK